MKAKCLFALTGLWAIAATTEPAFAHHSFAMFGRDREITLAGPIEEFRWT